MIIAIDGNSCAGKSTLADMIKSQYEHSASACNVFHMDDFFLQPHQQTPERFAEIGGNIDYERFLEEVLLPLKSRKPFTYRAYNCSTEKLGKAIIVKPKPISIIEGVYSMHPYFGNVYNLKLFLKIDERKQFKRLMVRNPDLYNRFVQEWLPMENRYFKTFQIAEKCDYIFNITD